MPRVEPKRPEDYMVVNRASGHMISHSAAEITVRNHRPVVSDEPSSRGGENLGPTPLEYVLAALCA
jgi:uncharacterized OsmC-like protein